MQTSNVHTANEADATSKHLSRPSPAVIAALFCGYLAVGLPLPVVPIFIHDRLGYSNFIVGLVIGIQFLATVLTRSYAGHLTDLRGGKRSALQGAVFCAIGGLCYVGAAHFEHARLVSLVALIAGRLASGLGESQFVTGCVSWSIASVGPQRAGMSMSWTGIAMFAALSIGAPAGMALYTHAGLEMTMLACAVAPVLGGIIALRATAYFAPSGQRLPFHKVVGQIWREGFGLMLQGVGLSGLTAFASLYFGTRGWMHAGLVMTAFGIGFIAVRVALANLPDRVGGYTVAMWSLVVEAVGQAMLWYAPNEIVALFGALVTGLGCALVFPALGVEALKRVLPSNRGSAMGAFVAFLDIAYGLAGPAAGLVAGHFGYAAVYLLGAGSAALGALLSVASKAAGKRKSTQLSAL